jgi:serine/threonine-protein phosphatase PPG1
VWQYFTDMFDFLTLSVVIDDTIFCVHGGLSPSIHHIDPVKVIDRFREIPHEGPMADLVWSDPDPEKEDFAISPRGAGYTFGASIVKKFLTLNGMNHVLRAHQLCMEGYSVLYNNQLSTVWSAPNYCYRWVLAHLNPTALASLTQQMWQYGLHPRSVPRRTTILQRI